MKHNYLIIKPDNQDSNFYEIHMMAGNTIEGLLKMHVKHLEGERLYYYEITSKQPLSRLLETRGMKAEEIKSLITGIAAILDVMEVYLLREENIWLNEDYIYVEPETYRIFLCLVPGLENNFPESMAKLLQFLLGKIDHKDKEGVVLAYGLFQESQKENYGIKDLMRVAYGGGEYQVRKEGSGKAQIEELDWEEVKKEEMGSKQGEFSEKSEYEELERNTRNDNVQKRNGREKKKKEKNRQGKKEVGTEDGGKRGEEKKETKNGKSRGYVGILLSAGIILAAWLLLGEEWVMANKIQIGAAAAVTMLLSLLILKGRERESAEKTVSAGIFGKSEGAESWKSEGKNNDYWMMELEEEEDFELGEKPGVEETREVGEFSSFQAKDTALLADLSMKKEKRKLVSLDKNKEEIEIAYFPFLIGKQEGMVDYVINQDTISRLHLRIDEEDGRYRITDLNSTNGTTLKGRMLEANESAQICPGDDLYIADMGYLFL